MLNPTDLIEPLGELEASMLPELTQSQFQAEVNAVVIAADARLATLGVPANARDALALPFVYAKVYRRAYKQAVAGGTTQKTGDVTTEFDPGTLAFWLSEADRYAVLYADALSVLGFTDPKYPRVERILSGSRQADRVF